MMANFDLDHVIMVLIMIVVACGLLVAFAISWALVSRVLAVLAVAVPMGLVFWLGYPSYRQDIVLDLRRPQDLSGIPPEHLNSMSSGDLYLFRRTRARVTLPDGTSFEKDMSAVTLKLDKNRLTEVRITSFGMPVREVAAEAGTFLQLMRGDSSRRQEIDDRISRWNAVTIESGIDSKQMEMKATISGLEMSISLHPAGKRGYFLYQVTLTPHAP